MFVRTTLCRTFPRGINAAKGAFIGNYPAESDMNPQHFNKAGVPYLTPGATVVEASAFLSKYDVGCVPVLDGERLVGMLSERDLARKLAEITTSTTVSDVMSTNVVVCSRGVDFADALKTMDENNFRHLPVTDAEGNVVGLLSMRDIVHQQRVEGVKAVDDFMAWVTKMSS